MKSPNIIFLLTDQHSASVAGYSGDRYVRTPVLDSLAQSGVSFTNCYCNSPLCVPSRSSMLSGLLPSRTGIFNNTQCLPSDKATFVHSLAANGYETVLSGRMHFVGVDQRHGFEKRLVGDITSFFLGLDFSEKRYGYLKGTSMPGRTAIEKSGKGDSSVLAFDMDVKEASCAFLKERSDDRPLFMTVGLYGPHPPYVGPEKLFDYYYETLPDLAPLSDSEKAGMHPADKKFLELRKLGNETVEEIRRVRAAYYAMVEYEDQLIGKILQTVEKTLDMDNTVIVYASDHGDSLGAHGMYAKSNFYENAARVPLIYYWKNHLHGGAVLNSLTSLLDLAPTFLDIAKATPLPVCDGESILDNISNHREMADDRFIISQLADIKGDNPSAMIRYKQYKMIAHAGYDMDLLFDLERDPLENNNLIDHAAYSEIQSKLTCQLKNYFDKEKSMDDLKVSMAHVNLLKKWAKNQDIHLQDEWQGASPDCNYLIVAGEKIC